MGESCWGPAPIERIGAGWGCVRECVSTAEKFKVEERCVWSLLRQREGLIRVTEKGKSEATGENKG
jgi:hypothetical protein